MSHPASIAASRSSAVGFVSCSWHMRQTATNRWPCLSACSPGTIAPPALRGRASCTSMLRTVQLSHEISHTGLSARNSATNLRRSGATAFRFADCRGIGLRLKFSGLRVSCLVLRLSGDFFMQADRYTFRNADASGLSVLLPFRCSGSTTCRRRACSR